MTTALLDGFTIIGLVTLMSLVVCPMLLWVLPDRMHTADPKTMAEV
jgi:hypothetical protein